MRTWLLLSAALAGVALPGGGCTVGEGTGSATGMLWILGCVDGHDLGSEAVPVMFDLSPTFFAGEPTEFTSDGVSTNRMIIRMQRYDNSVEHNDTLYFDVENSFEVARCVRGRVDPMTMQGDWLQGPDSIDPRVIAQGDWCLPADPNVAGSVARIHLFPLGPVRASLLPLVSCTSTGRPPAFVNIVGMARDGWIDFLDFGGAAQATDAPDARKPVPSDFKIGFGNRLHANFHIELTDERVVAAEEDMLVVPPAPRIGGTLDGSFDFDFERNRAAQTFP